MMAENKEAPPASKGASNQLPAVAGTKEASAEPILSAGSSGRVPLQVRYSLFNTKGSQPALRSGSWRALMQRLGQPLTYTEKTACPLMNMTVFDGRGKKAHNAQWVHGVTGDYDGEVVSIDQGADLLRRWNIEAFLFTTGSHTEAAPHWRVVAPLAEAAPASEYRQLVARLNWALDGILARESARVAQMFHYGKVQGVDFQVRHVEGAPLDDPILSLTLGEVFPDDRPAPQHPDGGGELVREPGGYTLENAREILRNIDSGRMGAYEDWRRVGMALHFEFNGSDEAFELWDEYSQTWPNYNCTEYNRARWNSFRRSSGPLCSWTTLEQLSTVGDLTSAFDDVSPTDDERADLINAGRAILDAKRREHQKLENEKIGEGDYRIPVAEKITLESALERFVFLSEGSLVADVFKPHYVLKLADWKNTYAASTKSIEQPNGKPAKEVPVVGLWHTSERRKTVATRTFKAGGGLMLSDPDGKLAVNSWRPFDRTMQVEDLQAAGVGLFVDHVGFLFGADAPRFLDWLAHIERCPGVLPHTSWLHIAKHFGMGRNWLASVLARVWAGSVAVNLDLGGMLRNGFNDRLSRKVLAVVDEIREGGRDSPWEHSEKLKSLITEEVRRINPKYGHTSLEFNACRWLLFSNHLSAIPLENGDRRVEVASNDAPPQDAAYYTRLYKALESPQFIRAVAAFLGRRDITGFNPGAHALNTEAKQAATKASQTPMAEACQLLIDHWPADFVTSAHLYNVMTEGLGRDSLKAAHRRTYEQAGIRPFGRKVRIKGVPTNVLILRNSAHWLQQGTAADVNKAYEHVDFDPVETSAYEFLLGLAADA